MVWIPKEPKYKPKPPTPHNTLTNTPTNTPTDLISRESVLAEFQDGRDVYDIMESIESLPSADRPKNMIHIDEVYRLIAGHSNHHGDSILSAFTCLVEGKDVKPIAPLDESADRPTGEWNRLSYDTFHCNLCGHTFIVMQGDDAMNYCPNCGKRMHKGGEEE